MVKNLENTPERRKSLYLEFTNIIESLMEKTKREKIHIIKGEIR